MDILVAWLGENQAAYARAKLAKSKERLLAPLVAQIVGIGFSNCKARDQRIHIKHLKEHVHSPYLRKFSSVLPTIFPSERRGKPAPKVGRKKLSATSNPRRANHLRRASCPRL